MDRVRRWMSSPAIVAPDASGMTTPLAKMLRHTPRLTVFERSQIKEITGDSFVEHLVVVRDDEQSWLRVDAVFADLGLLPNSGVVRRIAHLDADGFILVDEKNMTTLPGLFAAGDVTTALAENILIAIGEGTRAAVSAYEYLLAHPLLREAEPAD